jgi:hypothetical protein
MPGRRKAPGNGFGETRRRRRRDDPRAARRGLRTTQSCFKATRGALTCGRVRENRGNVDQLTVKQMLRFLDKAYPTTHGFNLPSRQPQKDTVPPPTCWHSDRGNALPLCGLTVMEILASLPVAQLADPELVPDRCPLPSLLQPSRVSSSIRSSSEPFLSATGGTLNHGVEFLKRIAQASAARSSQAVNLRTP